MTMPETTQSDLVERNNVLSSLSDQDLGRFWSSVGITEVDSCWPWLRSVSSDGYGCFSIKGRRIGAHRLSLAMVSEDMPGRDMLACHRCDNPPCVNPHHLFWGDHRANSHDAMLKGRLKKGSLWYPVYNAKKTHCPHGHPYSGENVYINKDGHRWCRECIKAKQLAQNAKRRAERAQRRIPA